MLRHVQYSQIISHLLKTWSKLYCTVYTVQISDGKFRCQDHVRIYRVNRFQKTVTQYRTFWYRFVDLSIKRFIAKRTLEKSDSSRSS